MKFFTYLVFFKNSKHLYKETTVLIAENFKRFREEVINMSSAHGKLVIAGLFVVVLGVFVPFAQGGQAIQLVRLTGNLYLPGQNGARQGADTFTVFTQGKEWIFNVKAAQDLTGNETGWEILQNTFPPVLNFRGPQNFIRPLEDPKIAGKLVTVEGYFYPVYGVLQVTALNVG